MSETQKRIKNMADALIGLPPLLSKPRVSPFVLWFELNRRKPLAVLVQEAGLPLVRIRTCWPELLETHYDHARAVNFRHAEVTDIDSTYATALMGGEPYSEWN